MTRPDDGGRSSWLDWDPARLRRDTQELALYAPDLAFRRDANFEFGAWGGTVPIWPFERPAPERLRTLVPEPLEIMLAYPPAYPVVSPRVYPVSPAPELMEMSESIWHVAPAGTLCLLQSEGFWDPRSSITDIIAKCAGWHIEYALMRLQLIERMTERGIAEDPTLDALIDRVTSEASEDQSNG
ncbi:hypothetical protein ITJ54_06610 [Curtobacterium sp. VKM Ac-2865]|uniref:hypothetical protein n=1 Tax=Curtobacterium sp. VKM Ac-2865 TaxID=2783817 RepID=UPI00188BDEF7|nr:hypothetical protein [Curtobacterium sp. VKM Ac-2865]MBF4582341.1 hypothetical protein [Curtobacterium sp. VKM Ac-2865]